SGCPPCRAAGSTGRPRRPCSPGTAPRWRPPPTTGRRGTGSGSPTTRRGTGGGRAGRSVAQSGSAGRSRPREPRVDRVVDPWMPPLEAVGGEAGRDDTGVVEQEPLTGLAEGEPDRPLRHPE